MLALILAYDTTGTASPSMSPSTVLLRERHYFHQQYLSDAKNPNGYYGISGTGMACPVSTGVEPHLTES